MRTNKVLVFPREIFDDVFSLLRWEAAQHQLQEIESSYSWLDRPDAECSTNLVQAIPCAFIRDDEGRYCALRRVKNARIDISKKLSLIVGGHIDDPQASDSFHTLVSNNLVRELEEEVGIPPNRSQGYPRPVGIIVDNSSIDASRHIAFVHEMTAEHVKPKAPEEFSNRSKFSGEFMGASDITARRNEFDPWSKLLIEEYFCPGEVQPQPRQRSFL